MPPTTFMLLGGLGNQLFQLAGALAWQVRTQTPVQLNPALLHPPRWRHYTPRTLAIADLAGIPPVVGSGAPPAVVLVGLDRLGSGLAVVERTPADDAAARIRRHTRWVLAYFHDHRIVDTVAEVLSGALDARLAAAVGDPDGQRPAAGEYLALHIRLGDFTGDSRTAAHHGQTDVGYYRSAVAELAELTGLDTLALVSDEPAAARALLADLPGVTVIAGPPADPWTDLATLADAGGIVMSNSSFSWWGAWCATRRRPAPVIAPRPWLAPGVPEPRHLLPASWRQRSRAGGGPERSSGGP